MPTTLKVEGLMCGGCEKSVTKVAENNGASNVVASHADGTVTFEGDVDLEKMKAAITTAGFKVVE